MRGTPTTSHPHKTQNKPKKPNTNNFTQNKLKKPNTNNFTQNKPKKPKQTTCNTTRSEFVPCETATRKDNTKILLKDCVIQNKSIIDNTFDYTHPQLNCLSHTQTVIEYYKFDIYKLNCKITEIEKKSQINNIEQKKIHIEKDKLMTELDAQYNDAKKELDDRYKKKINDIANNVEEYQSSINSYNSRIKEFKQIITDYIGDILIQLEPNVLGLVLDHLDSINIIYLLKTNKFFNNLIKVEYKNYILLYCIDDSYTMQMIKLPKNIFICNAITVEQILYVPLTEEGRTIIHLCARDNNISLLLCLHMMFPNLNVNVFTIDEQWHPVHNALNFGYYDMCIELFNIGIDHDYCIDNLEKLSITEQMRRNNITILYVPFIECTTKTEFKYKVLLADLDIIEQLKMLYNGISNINGILRIINL